MKGNAALRSGKYDRKLSIDQRKVDGVFIENGEEQFMSARIFLQGGENWRTDDDG